MSKNTEEELIEETFELSPLNALNPDEVDSLTPMQRKFLIAYISSASIPFARKASGVKATTFNNWKEDERFTKIFDIVKSPVAFAESLAQAIIFKAMLQHYEMLESPKESTRIWAIERAYAIRPTEQKPRGGEDQPARLTQSDVKLLAEKLNDHLSDEAKTKMAKSQPFSFVEGVVRELPVADVQQV